MNRITGYGVVLGMAVLVASVTGCANDRTAQFGSVLGENVKVGDYAPDFSYVAEAGGVETFARVRGVVTIVAFPEDPAWPTCARCEEIVALADKVGTGTTSVAIVSVASPGKGDKECAAALHRCAVKGRSQLVALHDHRGRVRSLYGPQAGGKYYIVDWTGRIAAAGSLADRVAMERALQGAVDAHQVHWNEVISPPPRY